MSDQKLQQYDADVQKAWNLLSAHNSELQLRLYELEKQIENRSVWWLIKYKIRRTVHVWLGVR